jgi:hypothetical protein
MKALSRVIDVILYILVFITITSAVEGLPELVGFIKAKTGDLFDTRRIPLQYKMKSR